MSVTLSQSLKDGGTSFSKLVEITISASPPDTETGYLLVTKSSSAVNTSTYDNSELIAVCSPEDIHIYGTAEIYPGYYRTNTAKFCFPTTDKKTAAINSLTGDLNNAVLAYRKAVASASSYTGTGPSSISSPLFGD